MTGRLWLLGLIIYGLLLLGLVALNGSLVALAIPLVLYLLASLLSEPVEPRLRAERRLSHDFITEGAQVEVKLFITNQGPQQQVLIEDLVPGGAQVVEGQSKLLTLLPSGGEVGLEYTLRAGRGTYIFQGLHVTVDDPFALLRRRLFLPFRSHLLVMPVVNRLRRVPIQPRSTHGFSGPIPGRRGGAGVNFFGVREYQMGDPMRSINWKATARHEEDFFTNEFEQERITDVGLILDSRHQNDIASPQGSLFEYAVQATASLADVFLREGHRVGLLIYGRGREATLPGYGKVQRQRILRALARARTGENLALENLGYLPTRFFPVRSQIVVVSPLHPNDLPVLVRLKALGYQVMVVSPDPVDFEAMDLAAQGDRPKRKDRESAAGGDLQLAASSDLQLASRVARVERALLLRRLQRAGIQVVDWRVRQPLDGVMQAALGRAVRAAVG